MMHMMCDCWLYFGFCQKCCTNHEASNKTLSLPLTLSMLKNIVESCLTFYITHGLSFQFYLSTCNHAVAVFKVLTILYFVFIMGCLFDLRIK